MMKVVWAIGRQARLGLGAFLYQIAYGESNYACQIRLAIMAVTIPFSPVDGLILVRPKLVTLIPALFPIFLSRVVFESSWQDPRPCWGSSRSRNQNCAGV